MPIIPIITLMPDRHARQFLGFLLTGVALCLVASELKALLLKLFGGDTLYVTSNVTPTTEEFLKRLPVLYFALCFSDDRRGLAFVWSALLFVPQIASRLRRIRNGKSSPHRSNGTERDLQTQKVHQRFGGCLQALNASKPSFVR